MNIFFIDTLELALPISILIAALLLISPLIKKGFVAKWRYFMWLFVAVRLILPFKISVFNAPITMEIPRQIQGMPVAAQTASTAQSASSPHISLQTILMIVWLLGIAAFTAYQIISYISFRRTVKRWAKPVANEKITAMFDRIKKDIGERRNLRLEICKTASTPMVFGFIKPTLLLPQDDYTEQELSVILRHELIHFKRNDILYKLVLIIANALNWFNPLVYAMVGAANKDIELACDEEVVKERDMEFRRGYCRAILTVVHNKKSMTTPLSTCFIISKNVIKERFADILDLRKKRKGVIMFAVVALSVAISGSLVSFATEKAAEALEDDLNIVERPTPKPAEVIAPTEVPAQAPSEVPDTDESYVPEIQTRRGADDGFETAADIPAEENIDDSAPAPTDLPEPSEAPKPEETPNAYAYTGKSVVNLNEQSNKMDIQFDSENETYQSSNAFSADEGTEMVVVSDGSVRVQIVDGSTGEVVREAEMNDDNNSITVPSGEYSINASSADKDSYASLYVYGKETE